jgi:hypothetical protein
VPWSPQQDKCPERHKFEVLTLNRRAPNAIRSPLSYDARKLRVKTVPVSSPRFALPLM